MTGGRPPTTVVTRPFLVLQQVPGTFAFLPPLRPLPDPRYLHRLLNLFETTPQTRTRAPTNIRRSRGKTFRVARASPASQASPRSTPCAGVQTAASDSSRSARDQFPTSILTTRLNRDLLISTGPNKEHLPTLISTVSRPNKEHLLPLDLQKKQDVSVSVGAVCMVRSVHSGMHARVRQTIPTDPTLPLLRVPHPQSPARTSVPILLSTATTWTSVTTTTTVGTHVFPACPICPACPAYPSHPSRPTPPFSTTASLFMPPLSHPRCPALLPP